MEFPAQMVVKYSSELLTVYRVASREEAIHLVTRYEDSLQKEKRSSFFEKLLEVEAVYFEAVPKNPTTITIVEGIDKGPFVLDVLPEFEDTTKT